MYFCCWGRQGRPRSSLLYQRPVILGNCDFDFFTFPIEKRMTDFAKFGQTDFKLLLNISLIWMVGGKGYFEHILTLGFILLTFVHAKWAKFRPTFLRPSMKFCSKVQNFF
jgi:hypothetical protein